ncbi:MAG: glutamine synthetase III [Bacteroidia bacterium]
MIRFTALQSVNQLKTTDVAHETKKSDILGKYVFSNDKLERYLGKQAYKAFKNVIDAGENITEDLADQIAAAMRTWAMEHGATHYTHWFQPLTGLTAEKHDSFLDIFNGQGIEKFSGGALIQQEPDASSFPNGGIRQTFEARGYTAWDPTSPAFLMQSGGGHTLCIPTIFVSYTGEALDYKAPLLKSVHQLDLAATAVCKYFDDKVNKVTATLGVEQEYFLVDAALFNARPDLVIAGRTLLGHSPAKGQQLDDHYFGSIPERVQTFMIDFENECLKLGIPLKTRHNEVAPSQFECAPNFEELNLAVDHNQLLMDVIDKVARRHNFRAVLHEKPYANVNGSGKHCNFSMGTNTGVNLLSPGKTPTRNLSFLTFFVNVIKAVSNHNSLMRASIASVGNDHRLGANEAPPAIISVFVGNQLSKVLSSLKNDDLEAHVDESEGVIEINAPQIPDLTKDNTDRNRTSPFAFTGNKFEFRAVGSTSNTSAPMTVLATAVADQLVTFKEEIDAKMANGESNSLAILSTLQQYITDSESVLFEGNNYSKEWEDEAANRGLSNHKTTPLALDAYQSESTKALFTRLGIMTERELEARHEILLESYTNKLQIESRLLGELAMTHVIPASVKYLNELIDSLAKLKTLGIEADTAAMEESVIEITTHISSIKKNVRLMIEERKKANVLEEVRDKAIAYCDSVKPYFDKVRYHADKLELLVDDNFWQLPKYRELLFLR